MNLRKARWEFSTDCGTLGGGIQAKDISHRMFERGIGTMSWGPATGLEVMTGTDPVTGIEVTTGGGQRNGERKQCVHNLSYMLLSQLACW
jgi:hypothetical protein